MFQEEYKRAYDNILPDKRCEERLFGMASDIEETKGNKVQRADEKIGGRQAKYILGWMEEISNQKVAGNLQFVYPCALFLCVVTLFTALPVVAKNNSTVYAIIERYAPTLAEYILPMEESSTREGITMQVEAIELVEDTAEILISFRDAEESEADKIHGKVDLYDSYYLRNLGADWQAGGCSFWEYDEMEDKAYFKISLTSSKAFSRNIVQFGVGRILTRFVEEEWKIDLDKLITNPKEKQVSLNGKGGRADKSNIPFFVKGSTQDSPLSQCMVMDLMPPSEYMMNELLVTGVAYEEGILRVQSCRGNLSHADRHLQPYLKDGTGNERGNDFSVSWQEEINGQKVFFDEHWFQISREELEQYELYGMFYITDGCIEGDWEVTFRLE